MKLKIVTCEVCGEKFSFVESDLRVRVRCFSCKSAYICYRIDGEYKIVLEKKKAQDEKSKS